MLRASEGGSQCSPSEGGQKIGKKEGASFGGTASKFAFGSEAVLRSCSLTMLRVRSTVKGSFYI